MTDYQKKKLIDLGFVLVGVVLVGLFLRTQLLNPKIIQVDSETMNPVLSEGKQYILVTPYTEESETGIDGFADVVGVSFTQDAQFVDLYLTMGELPEFLNLKEDRYSFSFYFDVNGDEADRDDVIIRFKSKANSNAKTFLTDPEAFEVSLVQNEGASENFLAQGEWSLTEGKLLIRVPYSKKLGIDAKTPVKVMLNHTIKGITVDDKLPGISQ